MPVSLMIGSDHAPHTLEENVAHTHNHLADDGVQTLLPIMLNHVNNGKLSYSVSSISLLVHAVYLVWKGKDALHWAMMLILRWLIWHNVKFNQWIASVSGWTPYDGVTVTGWPFIPLYVVIACHGKTL